MIIEANNEQDYLVYEIRPGGNVVEITDLAVNTQKRAGTGRKLVEKLIHTLRVKGPTHLYVFTRRSNEVARKFYEAVGFSQIAILPEFYLNKNHDGDVSSREDAVVYGQVINQ